MRIYIFFILILFCFQSGADLPVFIGEKESYTANTGFARRANSAAGIYNPSGLARIRTKKLSVSATAYQSYEQKITGEIEAGVRTFQGIPTQVTSTWSFGSSTLALSAFNTANYDFSIPVTYRDDAIGVVPSRLNLRENRLMVGPSFARVISEKTDFGISILIESRSHYNNSVLQARFTDPGSGASIHTLQQIEDKESSLVAVPILGFNSQITEEILLGLRIIPGSLQISGSVKSFKQGSTYVNTGAAIIEADSEPYDVEEDFKRRIPAEIGLGINAEVSSRVRILADIHHSFKMSYNSYQVGGVNDVEEESVELTNAFGGSIGTEITFGSKFLSMGALLTENLERADSSNAEIFYGVTGGWTTIHDLFESGVGGFYAVGERKDRSNTSKTTAIGLLLSTSYRF